MSLNKPNNFVFVYGLLLIIP